MEIKDYIKDNVFELLSIALFSCSCMFLINKTLLILILILSSLALSLIIFYFCFKYERKRIEELASLKFFGSFLSKLSEEKSAKISYENSAHFLIGYFPIQSYETVLETESCPYSIYRYSCFFAEILKKDKNNVALLPNYLPLRNDVLQSIESGRSFLVKTKNIKRLSFLIANLTVLVILTLYAFTPNLRFIFSPPFNYILGFLFSLVSPFIECCYFYHLRKKK